MNISDYRYICSMIGNLSGIPVRLYQDNEMVVMHYTHSFPRDPMDLYKDAILGIDQNAGYYMTENLSWYGFVKTDSCRLIIGPARQIPYSDQELRSLAFRLDVALIETDAFVNAMKSILHMPFESMIQMLCLINYSLNGEKLTVGEIGIYDSEQEALKAASEQNEADRRYFSVSASTQYSETQHNTMGVEETLLNIVSHGNTAALKEWLSSVPAAGGGVLAHEQLRQRKNMFIVTATLISRAAIRGGMDVEDALSLSDQFIQNCEMLNSTERISNLQFHMISEYTERVERIRRGSKPTGLTIAVANYIQHHLSEPISAENIAKEMYMSRPYLSRKFREESGKTLTDFILNEKTEEAKRLLRYTDKSSAAISEYLGFSSQAHFARTFKKYAGITPREYRLHFSR